MAPWLKVNPIGILIAAIAYMVIGIAIYSRWGLGRYWEEHVKHMHLNVFHKNPWPYLGAFASAIVIGYFMGVIQKITQVEDIVTGAFIGLIIWAGFVLPTIFSPVLFGRKPIQLFYLDCVFYALVYIVIGGITAGFNLTHL